MRIALVLACVMMLLEATLSNHYKKPQVQHMACKPQNWTAHQRACEWKPDDQGGGTSDPHWGNCTEDCPKVMDGFLTLTGLDGKDAAILGTVELEGCEAACVYMTKSGDYDNKCWLLSPLSSKFLYFGIQAGKNNHKIEVRIQIRIKGGKCKKATLSCAAGNRGQYCPGAKNYCLGKNFTMNYEPRNINDNA